MSAILHLIETGGPGGAEGVFLELAARLSIPGHRNLAAIGRDGWLVDQARRRGVSALVLPAQGSLNLRYLQGLIAIIRRDDVRLIIAHLFGGAVYASLAGIITRTPVISVLHGQSDVSTRERFAGLKRWIMTKGSQRVVFVSAALRDDLQPILRLAPESCPVIENGIDVDRYAGGSTSNLRASLGLPTTAVLIGAVGNVRAAKGYETLLQAAKIVCQRHPGAHFVIAGDTSGDVFPPLRRLLEAAGLEARVHFVGLRSDVPSVLASFDIYVLSSHTEGFSLALVEAMASGRAVIATRSGGPETIVEPDHTGLLVPPRNAEALASAITRLIEDGALKARLAAAAKVAIGARFGIDRMLKDYQDLARSLL